MKGIRGLLEKDFRLFRYQGGKFFLVIAIVGLFLSLAGNMGTNFVSIYITSVMAIYSGSTISYDEAEHGYNYLFSLPVNRKIYVQEKYIFSFILTVVGWCAGMICAGIAVMIKPGERFNLERLAESSIALMIILAISGIVITIKLKFEGEKGRLVFAIIFLSIFVGCYLIGYLVNASSSVEKRFAQVTKGDRAELACMVHFLYLQYESHEKERVLVIVNFLRWSDEIRWCQPFGFIIFVY